PSTTASLHNGTQVLNAASVSFVDANHLTVTFDLTGQPVGSYTLEAEDGTQSATAATPFQVTAPPPQAAISTMLIVPNTVRTGSPMSVVVKITNYGNNDVLLPPFQFTASDAKPPVITRDPGLLAGGHGSSKWSCRTWRVSSFDGPTSSALRHLLTVKFETPHQWATAWADSRRTALTRSP